VMTPPFSTICRHWLGTRWSVSLTALGITIWNIWGNHRRGHRESLHSFMIDHSIVIRSEARQRCSAAISQHGRLGIQSREISHEPSCPASFWRGHWWANSPSLCAIAGSNVPARPMKTRGCSLR
jgi:hypothetical protein